MEITRRRFLEGVALLAAAVYLLRRLVIRFISEPGHLLVGWEYCYQIGWWAE